MLILTSVPSIVCLHRQDVFELLLTGTPSGCQYRNISYAKTSICTPEAIQRYHLGKMNKIYLHFTNHNT